MTADFVNAAREWLEERIRSGRPGERLPTITEVARKHGIAPITVRRLYRMLAQRGAIQVKQGRGSFIAGGESTAVPVATVTPTTPTTSAERLAEFLADSIQRGLYRTGQALPGIKYMARHFHVAPVTVSGAYRLLVRRGIASPVGRWLRIGEPVAMLRINAGKTICLFIGTSTDFSVVYHDSEPITGPWMSQVYRILEMELQLRGFRLLYHRLDELPDLAESWRRRGNPPQGLCLHALTPSAYPEVLPRLTRIQRDAPEGRRPLVLVDWTGGDIASLPRAIHTFSRGGILTSLARTLARLALERGYRRVLFFADVDRPSLNLYVRLWNELRRLDEGIAFEVVLHSLGNESSRAALMQRLYAVCNPEVLRTKLSKYTATEPSALEAQLRLVSDFSEPFRGRPDRFLGVFLRDADAASALTLVRASGMEPPQAVGILGLENHPTFLHLGLSCCIPDWYGMGNQAARILAGEQPRAVSRLGFISTPTVLLDRGTA